MASMWGAPDYPLIFTKHPISNLTREELRARAEAMLEQIVTILLGTTPGVEVLDKRASSTGRGHLCDFPG